MNLGEKYFLIFISTFMLYALSSCTTIKNNVDIVDLGDNYEVKYKKDDARNKVFYNQLNGKKLNGYFKGNLRGDNYNSPQKPDSKLSYIFNLNLLYYEQKKIQTRF